jgi:hypothetical protein
LKGSYLKREIDGKLDPFSPYEGSGIKIDKNSSEAKTKITYINGNGTTTYDRGGIVSPSKYEVYNVTDNKALITNSPRTSNFHIYKESSTNQAMNNIPRPTSTSTT